MTEECRDVLFFWVKCGRAYKEVFNSHCKCPMLLDAIYQEAVPAIALAIKTRRAEIKVEIADIEGQQDAYAEDERLAAAKAVLQPAAETEAEVVVEAPPASASGKKKKGKDVKGGKQSKEEAEEEKRKIAEKLAEEEARKMLDTTKIRLGEEDVNLASEFESLKGVKRVDLFDSASTPCNLRSETDTYANTVLTAGGVYTLVSLEESEEGEATQIPIEVSI